MSRIEIALRRLFAFPLNFYLWFVDDLVANQELLINDKNIPPLVYESRKIAFIATYQDRPGHFDLDQAISELQALGYSTVTINNSDNDISLQCKADILRSNKGFDLMAFSAGMIVINNPMGVQLVLLNDSGYWKVGAISEAVRQSELSANDVTSLTISQQKKVHMQTYFLHIKARRSNDFRKIYCGNMKNWNTKRSASNFGELRLTKQLLQRGFVIGALFEQPIYFSMHMKDEFNWKSFRLRDFFQRNPYVEYSELIYSKYGFKKNSQF